MGIALSLLLRNVVARSLHKASALLDRLLVWWSFKVKKRDYYTIDKVLVFNEDPEETDGYCVELTGYMRRSGAPPGRWLAGFEDHVADWAPHFERYRLEVRYTHFGRKYRMVLRPGCEISWPPTRPRGGIRFPLDSVELVRQEGEIQNIQDVTSRVVKYYGPWRDYHMGAGGCRPSARDMFPYHDPDLFRGNCELHITDIFRNTIVLPFVN